MHGLLIRRLLAFALLLLLLVEELLLVAGGWGVPRSLGVGGSGTGFLDGHAAHHCVAVAVDGHIAFSGGYDLKAGARVSVRGHGKFIYDGAKNITKKGRTLIGVRVYV